MRLFIAIALSEKQKKEVSILQNRLKTYLSGVRWVRHETLHLTLRFLGETDETRLPELINAMDETTAGETQFAFSLKGSGIFPGTAKARVLWVGLDKGAFLITALAEKLDQKLTGLGFPPEKRPFRPHLTIGRLRYPLPEDLMQKFIEKENSFQGSSMMVGEITLFESILSRQGAVYHPLHHSALQKSDPQ
ncbi:MAG: RNA 2',3'-cyclic phosphodiesterase [Bacillota bacterium]|nr:RNA 2',3'-cyclic phosphodiesterase [Bacillota bacterium]